MIIINQPVENYQMVVGSEQISVVSSLLSTLLVRTVYFISQNARSLSTSSHSPLSINMIVAAPSQEKMETIKIQFDI